MTGGVELNKWWTIAARLLLFDPGFGAFNGMRQGGLVLCDDDLALSFSLLALGRGRLLA